MRTVDLFSGCGGMSLGFQSAGYNIVAAFENWPAAIECYKQNFKHPVIETDLSIVDEAIIRIKKYQPDLIIGGPPCQDFSNAGNRTEGERAELTHSFAKIITAVKPKFFVMENVARASESEAYKKARKLFIDNGYGLTEIVLDASHCNVPQKRNRFFCIGGLNQDDSFLSAILRAKQTVLPLSVRDYYSEKKYTLEFEYYYRHQLTIYFLNLKFINYHPKIIFYSHTERGIYTMLIKSEYSFLHYKEISQQFALQFQLHL